MTSQRDFKRIVRRRMAKTGEAYTAARAVLLRAPAPPPAAAPAPEPDLAAMAGMSDAALARRTGCTWRRWVGALDRVGAGEWPHREIARHVAERYRLTPWWAQTVTVGYERIKGLRARGQRRDGAFEATRSRTFAVPVARLYRAFRDARTRRRWLDLEGIVIRTATPDRSLRAAWPDGSSVYCWFTAAAPDRSRVQVQHAGLARRADAEARKAFWAGRLDRLAALLAPARTGGSAA